MEFLKMSINSPISCKFVGRTLRKESPKVSANTKCCDVYLLQQSLLQRMIVVLVPLFAGAEVLPGCLLASQAVKDLHHGGQIGRVGAGRLLELGHKFGRVAGARGQLLQLLGGDVLSGPRYGQYQVLKSIATSNEWHQVSSFSLLMTYYSAPHIERFMVSCSLFYFCELCVLNFLTHLVVNKPNANVNKCAIQQGIFPWPLLQVSMHYFKCMVATLR